MVEISSSLYSECKLRVRIQRDGMISAYVVKPKIESIAESLLFEIEAKNGKRVKKSELGFHCFLSSNSEIEVGWNSFIHISELNLAEPMTFTLKIRD